MNDKIMFALEPNQGHAFAFKNEILKKPQVQSDELEAVETF